MSVCLCCLNKVDMDFMLKQNNEIYHPKCYEQMMKMKEQKSQISDDIIDVTDSLVVDPFSNPINIKYSFDNFTADKPIGKYIGLVSDDKIMSEEFGFELSDSMDNVIFEEINNIIAGPSHAIDVAGNIVQVDKKYVVNAHLKSKGIKYKF